MENLQLINPVPLGGGEGTRSGLDGGRWGHHMMEGQSMGSHMGNRSWREEMLSSETIASTLAFSCQFFLPEVPTQTPFSPVLMLTRPARWVRSSLSWYQQRSPTEDRPDTSLSKVRSGKESRKTKEERMVATAETWPQSPWVYCWRPGGSSLNFLAHWWSPMEALTFRRWNPGDQLQTLRSIKTQGFRKPQVFRKRDPNCTTEFRCFRCKTKDY